MNNPSNDKKENKIPFNHEFCDSFEQAKKFGTYEIQPSNDCDNQYPAISQGLSKKDAAKINKEKSLWKKGEIKAED